VTSCFRYIFVVDMGLDLALLRYGLVFSEEDFIGIGGGIDVVDGCDVVGVYYVDGYRYRGCWGYGVSLLSYVVFRRFVSCLSVMNRGVDPFVIADFVSWYISDYLGYDWVKVNKDVVVSIFDWSIYNCVDAFWVVKRIRWVGSGCYLTKVDKMRISQRYMMCRRRVCLVSAIGLAIEELKGCGEFICSRGLHEELNRDLGVYGVSRVSLRTVSRYLSLFEDEVRVYNKSMFGVDNVREYNKMLNTSKIVYAAKKLGISGKRAIAREVGLHYNTVSNLWDKAFGYE
jgi:hypothetical protein